MLVKRVVERKKVNSFIVGDQITNSGAGKPTVLTVGWGRRFSKILSEQQERLLREATNERTGNRR